MQHRLEHAQQAADHLVDEARLLEQRLRLVEALDGDGQGDEGSQEDRPEPDHVGVLVGELRPVLSEERAERVAEVRREQEREHQRAEPEQAPDRALREAEHEEAEQDQEEDEIERGQTADERPKIHEVTSKEPGCDGRRSRARVAAANRRPQPDQRSRSASNTASDIGGQSGVDGVDRSVDLGLGKRAIRGLEPQPPGKALVGRLERPAVIHVEQLNRLEQVAAMAPQRGGHLGRRPVLGDDDREVTLDGRMARRRRSAAGRGSPPASPTIASSATTTGPSRSRSAASAGWSAPARPATRLPSGATTRARAVRPGWRFGSSASGSYEGASNPRRRQISSSRPLASSRSNGRDGWFHEGISAEPASAIPSRHHSRSRRRRPCHSPSRSRTPPRRRGRGGGSCRRPRGGPRGGSDGAPNAGSRAGS